MVTYFTPFEAEAAEAAILDMVNSAQKKIRLAAYGFTDTDLNDALLIKYQLGVDVKIVMDATEAAGSHQKTLVSLLQKAGIDVQIGKSPDNGQLLHSKFIVVDDKQVEWGSLNYGPTGLQQFNVASFQEDEVLAAQFTEAWDKIYQHVQEKNTAKVKSFWNVPSQASSLWDKISSFIRGIKWIR